MGLYSNPRWKSIETEKAKLFHKPNLSFTSNYVSFVWILGGSTERGLPSSRKERLIAQEIAKHGAKPDKVAVV